MSTPNTIEKYMTPATETTDTVEATVETTTESVEATAAAAAIAIATAEAATAEANAAAQAIATATSSPTKRDRSSDGTGSIVSPSPKRTVYSDGGNEVFGEDAPFWLPMLFKSMDNVSKKVSDMAVLFEDYKTHVDAQVTKLKEATDKRIDALESALNAEKEKNAKMSDTIVALEKNSQYVMNALLEHDRLIDASEQYSRRNCVLLHGVKEEKNEKTDDVFINTISKQLGIKVERGDIDRSHRIGAPRTNGRHRAIIVKFARYNVRATVFRAKRKFKNSGMLLTDSLTRRRIEILNEARERYGRMNVWTTDGEIFTKINNMKVNITRGPPVDIAQK